MSNRFAPERPSDDAGRDGRPDEARPRDGRTDRAGVRDGRTDGAGSFSDRVLDASPIATVVVDRSGDIVYANDRAEETLGRSREEVTGRRYDEPEWNTYDEGGAPVTVEDHPVTRVFETGEPDYGFEHWIELPDGTERWLSSNSVPLFDEEEVEFAVVSFEDVTAMKRREERLTSDHVRLLEYRTDRAAVPPSLRAGGGGETRIDVESVIPLPNGTVVQYMSTADLPASEFVDAVEEVPHYLEARLLSTVDGRTRVEAHADSATVSQTFQSLGGRPRAVVIAPDEVRFLGELPGDVDPRRAAAGIREFHSDVELVSGELVYSPHLLSDIVSDALTERQLAALDAAYFGGYFDSPRKSTGEDLAKRFGVTRQTFNQHLRSAQRVVFRHLFEKSGADGR
ncbi:bacterio-opsin activator domain-containing protein [Halovivax sp.]|uniref:bacterio-opsin activator domain-containing protein n=1 Tax=Halovivax sp. TaxID=1935978 RepID=UPI0025B7C52F|nr:bacterio-opsin activator domain-containing protein [Halovivax sp.]